MKQEHVGTCIYITLSRFLRDLCSAALVMWCCQLHAAEWHFNNSNRNKNITVVVIIMMIIVTTIIIEIIITDHIKNGMRASNGCVLPKWSTGRDADMGQAARYNTWLLSIETDALCLCALIRRCQWACLCNQLDAVSDWGAGHKVCERDSHSDCRVWWQPTH